MCEFEWTIGTIAEEDEPENEDEDEVVFVEVDEKVGRDRECIGLETLAEIDVGVKERVVVEVLEDNGESECLADEHEQGPTRVSTHSSPNPKHQNLSLKEESGTTAYQPRTLEPALASLPTVTFSPAPNPDTDDDHQHEFLQLHVSSHCPSPVLTTDSTSSHDPLDPRPPSPLPRQLPVPHEPLQQDLLSLETLESGTASKSPATPHDHETPGKGS